MLKPEATGVGRASLLEALHAACSTAERIAFRQVNKATGNRLRQQLIDEETRAPVALEDRGRGYEVVERLFG
jgi:DNA end-binding protein Ku